ncbi:MAG: selenocysteine-specific translation elongation factor [bacterium]|nr:selenocysteine-specific translation elongation factor [bacterium]
MKNVVIGLAGHIDHGKTALAKALTGIDTDRLKEEKERGISIESGFAPCRLPNGQLVSIVDCPGHEKFIKNMLRGISGVDVAILVVAADDGPMPQTREHLDILALLGIRRGLVVINKIDLVDRDWLELVHEEIIRLIEPTFLRQAPIINCSCRSGEGIEQLKKALMEAVDKVERASLREEFRLPVDRVFSIPGYGTVATGTLVDGEVMAGSTAVVYPEGRKVKIRALQVHNQWVEEAQAGQRVGFNLANIGISELKRGDVIASPGSLLPTTILDARLRYLESNLAPLTNRTRVRLHTGTTEVIARVIYMDREKIEPGEQAIVQFRLEEKVAPAVFDRYIIRSLSPAHTIGGGVILDAYSRRYSATEGNSRAAHLKLLEEGKFEQFIIETLSRYKFHPCTRSELIRKTALSRKELDQTLARLQAEGEICPLDDEEFLISSRQAICIKEKLIDTLKDFHRKNPLEKGMGKELLRSKIAVEIDSRLFHHLIRELEMSRTIVSDGPTIRLADHSLSFSSGQKEIIKTMERELLASGLRPLKITQLYQNIPHRGEEVDRLLKVLIDQGIFIRIAQDTIMHSQPFHELREMIKAHIKEQGKLTLHDFRDQIADLGRIKTVQILEYLDSIGFTRRIGDIRVLTRSENK